MQIESLRIRNFRVFRDVAVRDIPQTAVFVGQNGVGKTTFFDVFAFLRDCLAGNVRSALAVRGGFQEVVSREQKGDIGFTIRFRPSPGEPAISYELSIGEDVCSIPAVKREILWLHDGRQETPRKILDFAYGEGTAIRGTLQCDPELQNASRFQQTVSAPDILAVKGLGQFADFPAVVSLRRLIENWYIADFHTENARGRQEANRAESLSATGENLAQAARFLYENHRDRFDAVLRTMRERIPGVTDVQAILTEDGYVALRFQDGRFKNPFSAKFVSDGTLKMFAYLLLLSDPNRRALLCVEEPENQLYPDLLPLLAEEFRSYASGGQVFISTHSPNFLNAVRLEELYCLRKTDGFTEMIRAAELPLIASLYREGDLLGELWQQGILLAACEGGVST